MVGGYLLHRYLVSRVTGIRALGAESEGHYAQLILTLGVALILQNGGLILFGSTPQSIRTPLSASAWEIGLPFDEFAAVFVNKARVVSAVISVAATAALYWFIARARLGKALRAAADNPEAAVYMGIDVDRAHRIAFGIGTGVTAIAGGLVATYYPFQPYVGLDFVIIMYAGVVLGGMGSITGAFWGGMTIGLVQQLSVAGAAVPAAERRHLRRVPADRAGAAAGAVRPQRGADVSALAGSGRLSSSLAAIVVFTLIYAIGSAFVTNKYYQLMLTLVPIWAVMGLSWNILSGYAGLVSFGHAAFFGLGAYTVTLLLVHFDLTPWFGIPLGDGGRRGGRARDRLSDLSPARPLLRAVHARLSAGAALRVRMARLSGGRAADEARPTPDGTCSSPIIASTSVWRSSMLVAALLVSLAVERSRFGLALLAIKQNEPAAEAAGIDTLRWKMRAIVLSGALAALAGGLYAVVLLVITPQTVFGMLTSAQALVVTSVRRCRHDVGAGHRRVDPDSARARRCRPIWATSSPASRAWSTGWRSSS